MEIQYFYNTISRGKWLILSSLLIALNLSLFYSYFMTEPSFQASARLLVSPDIAYFDEPKDLADSLDTLDKRSVATTYAEIIGSQQIFNKTLAQLGVNPADYKDYSTEAVVLPDTNILKLTVKGPGPDVAAVLANNIGQVSIAYLSDLYQIYDINFVDRAIAPKQPFQPKPLQDALLALLLGGAVGVALALFREQLSISLDGITKRMQIDKESNAFSRQYFERRLREEITQRPDNDLSLGFIYLNGIHDVVDSLPQEYVNKIMRSVTETLKHELRGNDIVGRWSKLRFGVLLPGTPGVFAERTLARIGKLLEEPMVLDPDSWIELPIEPHVGIANRTSESVSALITNAENALETALQAEGKVHLFKDN